MIRAFGGNQLNRTFTDSTDMSGFKNHSSDSGEKIEKILQYTPVQWDSQGTIKIGPTQLESQLTEALDKAPRKKSHLSRFFFYQYF